MIKITVVTCTYNAESTVESTLQSVAAQTYATVEHLIIDGASRDDTLRLAESYRQGQATHGVGREVLVISEPDSGLYDAMNKALRLATGDYIVFLNAGDRFPDSHTLSYIASSAGEGETLPGVLFGDTDIIDNDGHFLRHRRLHPGDQLSWKSFRQGMLVCHQAFYALTSIARQTPYNTDYRYSADIDWCIRVMRQAEQEGRSLRNVHRVVAEYLDEGLTTANHKKSLIERFQVMRRHYGLLQTILQHLWFVVRAVIM